MRTTTRTTTRVATTTTRRYRQHHRGVRRVRASEDDDDGCVTTTTTTGADDGKGREGANTSASASSSSSAASPAAARKDKPLPGSGVNLYDPVATASRFLTRRFGIVGGLGLVALLASVEGGEIVKALLERDVEASGEIVELESGLKVADARIGGGASPKKGDFVGVNLLVADAETGAEYLNTKKSGRPIAFTFEKKPLLPPVCEAIEEGVRTMKRGGVRTVYAPSAKAYGERGVVLNDGTRIAGNRDLKITITLEEVSPSYV